MNMARQPTKEKKGKSYKEAFQRRGNKNGTCEKMFNFINNQGKAI